jgi:hypothetical protein
MMVADYRVAEVILKNRFTVYAPVIFTCFLFNCSLSWAECSLNIEGEIASGWNKADVSYTVDGRILKIKTGNKVGQDADSIYIGSITGCDALTIQVRHISGSYPWDGKAIGFAFFNDKLEPHQWGNQASFPAPLGFAIDDGFIKAALSNSTRLVYGIADSSRTTYIGAKIFLGGDNALELELTAEETPREARFSLRQPSPSARPYMARTSRQSQGAGISCSTQCHQPAGEDGEVDFLDEVSMPADAVCPHRSD